MRALDDSLAVVGSMGFAVRCGWLPGICRLISGNDKSEYKQKK